MKDHEDCGEEGEDHRPLACRGEGVDEREIRESESDREVTGDERAVRKGDLDREIKEAFLQIFPQ